MVNAGLLGEFHFCPGVVLKRLTDLRNGTMSIPGWLVGWLLLVGLPQMKLNIRSGAKNALKQMRKKCGALRLAHLLFSLHYQAP